MVERYYLEGLQKHLYLDDLENVKTNLGITGDDEEIWLGDMEEMESRKYFEDAYGVVKEAWPQLLPHCTPFAIQIDYMHGRRLSDCDCNSPSDIKGALSISSEAEVRVYTTDTQMKLGKEQTIGAKELFDLLSRVEAEDGLKDEIKTAIDECEQVIDSQHRKAVFEQLGMPVSYNIIFHSNQSIHERCFYDEMKNHGYTEQECKQCCVNNIHGGVWDSLFSPLIEQPIFQVSTKSTESYPTMVELIRHIIKKYLAHSPNNIMWFSDMVDPSTHDGEKHTLYLYGIILETKFSPAIFKEMLNYEKAGYGEVFIHKAINVVFQKWVDIHGHRLYSSNSSYIMSHGAIMQLAARDMTMGNELPDYEIINLLSAAKSEGAPCHGTIVFTVGSDREFEYVKLSETIPFNEENIRYIRKLLEMTADAGTDFALVADSDAIIGLAQMSMIARQDSPLYFIKFRGPLKWTLKYKNTGLAPEEAFDEIELLSFDESKYHYSIPMYEQSLSKLSKFFGLSSDGVNELRTIVENACSQKHGTMLVIFKDAKTASAEAERLIGKSRGLRFDEPQNLLESKELLLSITALDGAVVLDSAWNCHGFGIIVDGAAAAVGSPARGARYNSAKNYVACCKSRKKSCAAIVVSEDESIDVFTTEDDFD